MIANLKNFTVSINFERGIIEDLVIDGKSRLIAASELFTLGFRSRNGERFTYDSSSAISVQLVDSGAIYSFSDPTTNATVKAEIKYQTVDNNLLWTACVTGQSKDVVIEWVDLGKLKLPSLQANDAEGGKVLWPFNEGVLVEDITDKEKFYPAVEPVYPSQGSYAVFPNMLSSQMMAYIWNDKSLYVGTHDKARAVKGFDFFKIDGGVELRVRLFSGVNYGEKFETDYPVVWSVCDGRWESAAKKYRDWFESEKPKGVIKIKDNTSLPEWYESSPLVVAYPVQGRYDSDPMSPNCYIPYVNALPMLDKIQCATKSRLLVLLMHWEGTAPWAPPYVWPPVGGEESLMEFNCELHKRNNLLGLYSSGFGYTIKSNLIPSYDMTEEYEKENLSRGMCAGINGEIKGVICTVQRKGYDICPASKVGREILDKAYTPLFNAGIDYLQVLDQNHGGGQYLCYEDKHGHPTAPGKWMTENMQELQKTWKSCAPNTVFGCESAAAEPFISTLLFNDNRFELCLKIGDPVPLYQYVYHEYVRNFMGNQVGCPIRQTNDTLRFRIAYSFSVGDGMSIVINPDGKIMAHWGREMYENKTDTDKTLLFIKNLTQFYNEKAKKYLYNGRMSDGESIQRNKLYFERRDKDGMLGLYDIYYSYWEDENARALILVNPTDNDVTVSTKAGKITVKALNAEMVEGL